MKKKYSLSTSGARGAVAVALLAVLALVAGVAQAQSAKVFNRTRQVPNLPPSALNTQTKATCLGDVDNDGAPDLVVGYMSTQWPQSGTVGSPPSQFTIKWFRNTGTDTWTEYTLPIWTTAAYAIGFESFDKRDVLSDIHVADIDRDGRNDIVFCTHVEGIHWWRRTGLNTWETNPRAILGRNTAYNWHHNTRKLAVTDLDIDGDVDVAVVFGEGPSPTGPNTRSRIGFFYHNAVTPPTIPTTWSWVQIEDYNTLDFPVSIRAANVVGDARPELFICARANNRVRWYCGSTGANGTLSYPARLDIASGAWYHPWDVAFGDVNQNGRLDLFVAQRGTAGSQPSIRLLYNNGVPDGTNWTSVGAIDFSRTPTDGVVRNDEYPIFLKSADFDADGDADLFASFNRLDSPAAAAGQVVYYENMDGAGGAWTQTVLPTGAASPYIADVGPMNIDLAPVLRATPTPAGYPDNYMDLLVVNNGSRTLSFWNNTTYTTAPYLVAPLVVVGARAVRITFSEAMTAGDAVNAAYYTASGAGRGSVAANPTSVTFVSGTTYELGWNAGCLQLGGSLTITVNKGMRDAAGYRIREPRSLTVTVTDTMPPVAVCQNRTAVLAPTSVVVTAAQINNGSTDNWQPCADPELHIKRTGDPDANYAPSLTFTCADLGGQSVTLRARDASLNASTCTATVTVVDNQNPVAVCQNITVQLDGTGNAAITAAQVDGGSSDNCGFTLGVSRSAFTCADVGGNTVTLTVTDSSGNSDTCTATVTVEDVEDPVAVCQNIAVQLDGTGNIAITAAQVDGGSSDNCGFTLGVSPSAFTCDDVGDNTVTLTVTDSSGNVDTCAATVTVEDVENPTVNPAGNPISVHLDAFGQWVFNNADKQVIAASASDNCGIDWDNCTVNPPSVACVDVSPPTVPVSVTIVDVNGRVAANTCDAQVTVVEDPPTALCKNYTLVLDANGAGSITPADIDDGSFDACDGFSLSLDVTDFDCTDIGDNPVVLTILDDDSNSDTCGAIVTVVDNEIPVAVCQDITVQLDATGNVAITASQVDGGSSDNCEITLDVVPNAFTCDDIGENTVTLTVTDTSGNSDTCTAVVTVEDNELPVAVCQDITVQLDATGNIAITAAQVDGGSTDNCGIALDVLPNTFTCANVGDNIVTLTVTDGGGNIETCTATVTVEDIEDPTVNPAGNPITVYLDSSGQWTFNNADKQAIAASASDNCGIDWDNCIVNPLSVACLDMSPPTVPVSVTIVDVNGRLAGNTCDAEVTVADNVPPDARCVPGPIEVQLNAEGVATLTAEAVDNGSTDNCDAAPQLSLDVTSFDCEDLLIRTGVPVPVTLTVQDDALPPNSATCTVDVNVVDRIAPVITLHGGAIVVLFVGNPFTDPGVTALDACDGEVSVVTGGDTVDTNVVGEYVITYDAEDNSGNAAPQAKRTVQVLSAGGPPVIVKHPEDQSVIFGETAAFDIVISAMGTVNFQWRKNGAPLSDGAKYSGVNTPTLMVLNAANADEGQYDCVVSNVEGSVTSDDASLTVADPAITEQPKGRTVGIGQTATFTVTAIGSGTITYQWYRVGTPPVAVTEIPGKITGVTSPTLTILNAQQADEDVFFVTVTGADGTLQSNNAGLYVGDPVIVSDPADQVVPPGTTVQFSVVAQGTPPLLYRWRKDGVPLSDGGRISNSATSTLTISSVTDDDEGYYSCVVVGQNTVESNTASLRVGNPPVIDRVLVTPMDGNVPVTGSFSLTVVMASGDTPFTYQWFRSGTPLTNDARISGSTGPTLSIIDAVSEDTGGYTVRVSNPYGVAVSDAVMVNVGLRLVADLRDAIAEAGMDFTWSIRVANGIGSIDFQWLKESEGGKALMPLTNRPGLSGVTTDTLAFTPVTSDDAGLYAVQVSDDYAVIQTRTARLQVTEQLDSAGALLTAALAAALAALGAFSLRRRRDTHGSLKG